MDLIRVRRELKEEEGGRRRQAASRRKAKPTSIHLLILCRLLLDQLAHDLISTHRCPSQPQPCLATSRLLCLPHPTPSLPHPRILTSQHPPSSRHPLNYPSTLSIISRRPQAYWAASRPLPRRSLRTALSSLPTRSDLRSSLKVGHRRVGARAGGVVTTATGVMGRIRLPSGLTSRTSRHPSAQCRYPQLIETSY
jgi:hypothetical protein